MGGYIRTEKDPKMTKISKIRRDLRGWARKIRTELKGSEKFFTHIKPTASKQLLGGECVVLGGGQWGSFAYNPVHGRQLV